MLRKCKTEGCYSDGSCYDLRCPIHTRATKRKKEYRSGKRAPTSAVPHLGVEVECVTNNDTVHKAMLSQWKGPHADNSLGNYGCEYKFCHPVARIFKDLPRFVAKLAAVGARVDRSCGLHVHLDARNVLAARKHEFLDWLATWQEWMFGCFPESRRHSMYCVRISTLNHGTHYTWANITSYGTVEIRIHNGTLNPHKMAGWIHAMADLADLLRSNRPLPVIENGIPTDSQLGEIFPDPKGRTYLKTRRAVNGSLRSSMATEAGLASEVEN